MRSGWLGCAVVAASFALLVSCGSSSNSTFLYLVSQGSSPGTVNTYSVNLNTGTLESNNGVLASVGQTANAGTQPTNLLFEPKQTFAYTANLGSDDISTFTVSKDGSLTAAGSTTPVSTTMAAAARPLGLAIDPGAHFLFVANQGDPARKIPGNISVFSIGSGGALTAAPGSPFSIPMTSPPLPVQPVTPLPVSVAVSNQGNFVYVADQANGAVAAFSFDSGSGALTAIPAGCATSPTCFGFLAGSAPSVVFSPPKGNFLYVANAGSNDVYTFSIDATKGTLIPLTSAGTTNPIIVPVGIGPIAMLSDPGAKFVYVLANQGAQVVGFTMNQVTGELTAITANGGTVSTGANPVALAIRSTGLANGNFWLFTANNGGSSVSTFNANFSSGALTALPQATAPLAPYGIAVR